MYKTHNSRVNYNKLSYKILEIDASNENDIKIAWTLLG